MTPQQETQLARMVAERAHDGQTDMSGQPYFEHCRAVADQFAPSPGVDSAEIARLKTVAFLHDVVEDTDTTLMDLLLLGFSFEILEAVNAITQQSYSTIDVISYEPLEDYWARVKANPLAVRVKIADIRHNNDPVRKAQLSPERQAKLSNKYQCALEFLVKQ